MHMHSAPEHEADMILVWYCQFDVSPVNYTDSDSETTPEAKMFSAPGATCQV